VKRYWSLALVVAVCSATVASAQVAQDQVRRQSQAVRQAVQEQNARRAQDRAAQEQARQAIQDQTERRNLPEQPGGQNVQNQAERLAAQQNQNNRAQQLIMDFYLSSFRSTVGLNEDQFLKVRPDVRQFIQNRFRVATQRSQLNQRLTELLSQANPSESEVQQLQEDLAQLELTAGRAQNNLINRVRPVLTARQVLMVLDYNKSFFEEQLPRLLERAREENAARGQAPQQTGPNNNKNKAPVGDSFRER
jgi:hypothetical protein